MCIIVAKPKGVDMPTDEIIKTCFKNNSDGAGFMYQVNDYVKIEKGFMSVDKMLKRLHTLANKLDLKNKNVVLHFRIGTSGKNDKKTTHPFPISSEQKDLQTLSIHSQIAMCHNGILNDYVYTNSPLSDTQNFVKDYVSMLYELNVDFLKNKKCQTHLADYIGSSKLAFIDSKDKLYLIGNFVADNGIYYSNTTYKECRYSYYNYGYSYDSLYDYDKYDYKDNYYISDNFGYVPKDNDIIMDYEDLMLLDSEYQVQKTNGNFDKVNDKWLAIDKDYNLYEILDFWSEVEYIVNKIDFDVSVYDKDYNFIEFMPNA